MIIAQLALLAAFLLIVAAILIHFRGEARTRKLGGFYVVPDTKANSQPQPLRPALKLIEGGKS